MIWRSSRRAKCTRSCQHIICILIINCQSQTSYFTPMDTTRISRPYACKRYILYFGVIINFSYLPPGGCVFINKIRNYIKCYYPFHKVKCTSLCYQAGLPFKRFRHFLKIANRIFRYADRLCSKTCFPYNRRFENISFKCFFSAFKIVTFVINNLLFFLNL